MRRVLLVGFVLMLVAAACSGSSDSGTSDETAQTSDTVESVDTPKPDIPTELGLVAQFTCNQTAGATPESATRLIEAGVKKAAASGFSGTELRDAMRVECPDTMDVLEPDAGITALFEG
ncbi:MAG: hypothetical protein GWP18_00800 [Proteobacteria bacterium]|nr:hypothetical protein [Pseudomonadota bacterium]